MSKTDNFTTTKIKEIARDQRVSEIVLSDFIIQESDVFLTVLEQLSFAEQDMLKNLINQLKSKKTDNPVNPRTLLVIHNLMNLTNVDSIKNFINKILLNSLTFDLRNKEQPMAIFKDEQNNDDRDKKYYVQKTDEADKLHIFHIVIGNDKSPEVRKQYNEPAIRFIRKMIMTATSKRFDLINAFINFLIKNSKKYLNGN